MAKPYVAQDNDGSWYADCEGVMQGHDPARTREQALEWCVERLWHKLCQIDEVLTDEQRERLAWAWMTKGPLALETQPT